MGPTRAALALAVVALAAPAAAAGDGDTVRRARVAVRVGTDAVTVGELEDRLAAIPPFQVATFGASREEIVRAFTDQVVIRELVLGAGASARKLGTNIETRHQLQRALSSATLRARRADLRSPAAIPMDEVTRFYEANRARFESPERVNLWRILCATREEAAIVLADAKRDLTIQKWGELARAHSIDQATKFRGGNLGFLSPDGTSNEAGVKVDPALVSTAAQTKDGELVPVPIAEGSAHAVVWRRTTVAATKRSLEDAAAQIRTTLFRERTETDEKKLIEDLRARKLKDLDPEPLKIIEFPAIDAGLSLPRSVPPPAPSSR